MTARADPATLIPIRTTGTTLSLRWAATSAMRRFVHEGQTQRPLQLKATSRSWRQSVHRVRLCYREPGLEVMLNELVERRVLRAALPI